MKKIGMPGFAIAMILSALTMFSCESLGGIVGQPSLSVDSVAIKTLDLEGITFTCNYAITNPYPVAFKIKGVNADVDYDGSKFTSISADKGIKVEASGTRKNEMQFKVPYDTIIRYASSTNGKTSLPFSINGNAALDISSIPYLSEADGTLNIPFKKDFEVPVFKPNFSVSNAEIVMPSMDEIKDAFIGSGMSIVKAAAAAASLISGRGIPENLLDGVDMNIDVKFNLNVTNQGSAPWKFLLSKCALTSGSKLLANVKPDGTNVISSSSGTIPVTASLNTLTAGEYVIQMLNKKGKNPTVSIDSALSFTELKYAQNLPLNYSYEIPLGSIKTK